MLIQSFWLTSLLPIASATAYAYPPVGLKPRYLSAGTDVSLSFTPYRTDSANGTAISTETTYPLPSISTAAPVSTSSAPAPTTTSSDFYLVAAGTGTYLDGQYLYVGGARGAGHGDLQVMIFTPDLPPEWSLPSATFHLAANGTILPGYGGDGRTFGSPPFNYWFFNQNPILEVAEVYESVCEIVAGELKCVTGPNTVFYVCMVVFVGGPYDGQAVNDNDLIPLLGPEVYPGCNAVPLTLRVVPV